MKLRPIPDDEQLPDGLYLTLEEDRYFKQRSAVNGRRALGTSDLATLWLRGVGWWWQSPNNPFYRGSQTAAKTLGSAYHCLLLEGKDAYEKRFVTAPDPNDYPDRMESVSDMKAALVERGHPIAKGNAPKVDWINLAKVYITDRPVWDDVLDRFARQNKGKEMVSAEEAFSLNIALEAALSDPDMSVACHAGGGVPLPEVSVLYTLPNGERIRYRCDSFLPSLNVDLKTLDNFQNKPIDEAVGKNIGDYALDVQAAMSFEARRWAYYYIETGHVYGGTQEQVDWVELFPKMAPLDRDGKPGWGFLWIFVQKPDSNGRAPVLMPVRMDFGSSAHLEGYRCAMHGLSTYLSNVEKFGIDKPWRQVLTARTLQDDGAGNGVNKPFYIKRAHPVPDEEEAMKIT